MLQLNNKKVDGKQAIQKIEEENQVQVEENKEDLLGNVIRRLNGRKIYIRKNERKIRKWL